MCGGMVFFSGGSPLKGTPAYIIKLINIDVAGQIEPSGQLVSTQVNFFQPRSICFNPGHFVST